jgi:hypothetical protein
MDRIHPEYPDSDPPDRSVAADALLDKSQTRRKTKATAKEKMTMMTTKTTTATRSECAFIYFSG